MRVCSIQCPYSYLVMAAIAPYAISSGASVLFISTSCLHCKHPVFQCRNFSARWTKTTSSKYLKFCFGVVNFATIQLLHIAISSSNYHPCILNSSFFLSRPGRFSTSICLPLGICMSLSFFNRASVVMRLEMSGPRIYRIIVLYCKWRVPMFEYLVVLLRSLLLPTWPLIINTFCYFTSRCCWCMINLVPSRSSICSLPPPHQSGTGLGLPHIPRPAPYIRYDGHCISSWTSRSSSCASNVSAAFQRLPIHLHHSNHFQPFTVLLADQHSTRLTLYPSLSVMPFCPSPDHP